MHRWWGNSADSSAQASQRDQRAARRIIASLDLPLSNSDDEDEYKECDLSTSFLNLDGQDDADTSSNSSTSAATMPAVKFQDENADDDEDYYKKLSTVKNRVFNRNEVEFYFTSLEASLKHIGVKNQWSKREILHNLLPEDIQTQVKHILKKDQDTAGTHPYKTLKLELIKICINQI